MDEDLDFPDVPKAASPSADARAPAYKRPSVNPDTGAIVLDEQHERYCQSRAEGFGKTQSYRYANLHEGKKVESLGPCAHELESRPYISERIAQIKEERLSVASSSESRQESISRWNDLYQYGKTIGGKEGIKLMVDAQKQLDKIMAFDKPDGVDPEKKVLTFIDAEDWQESAKRLLDHVKLVIPSKAE